MAKRSRTAAERADQTDRLRTRPARARLLAAARELASSNGYESIKAGHIATAAGVSRETFYTHFADKRSCLAEATAPRLAAIEAELRMAAEQEESWAAPILAGLDAALHDRYGSRTTPRGRIIEAMLDLVAERGYPATRLADVIKAAKVSYPSFYRHFTNKEECFRLARASLIERLGDQLQVRLDEEAEHRHRLVVLAGLLAAAPESIRVLVRDAAAASREGSRNADDQVGSYVELITGEPRAMYNAHASLRVGAFTELLRKAALSEQFDALPGEAAALVKMLGPESSNDRGTSARPARAPVRTQRRRGSVRRSRALDSTVVAVSR